MTHFIRNTQVKAMTSIWMGGTSYAAVLDE